MVRRRTSQDETTGVILSAAKNLVGIRGAAHMPRSFAALRMTTTRASLEKIDTLEDCGHDERRRACSWAGAASFGRRLEACPELRRRGRPLGKMDTPCEGKACKEQAAPMLSVSDAQE